MKFSPDGNTDRPTINIDADVTRMFATRVVRAYERVPNCQLVISFSCRVFSVVTRQSSSPNSVSRGIVRIPVHRVLYIGISEFAFEISYVDIFLKEKD